MAYKVEVSSIHGEKIIIFVEFIPGYCPYCHHKIVPLLQTGFLCSFDGSKVKLIFGCPNDKCGEIFMVEYNRYQNNYIEFEKYIGGTLLNKEFGKEIEEISSKFVKIYKEAAEAENINLNEICGVAYRKALEFLIKDYVISKNKTDADKIKKMNLSAVIENFIEDPRIKDISKRAVWLGNDETHYYKIWENKTIEDIKKLIELTVFWIKTETLSDEIVKDMTEPSKKK
jgi:uncharacterized protein DUF4145